MLGSLFLLLAALLLLTSRLLCAAGRLLLTAVRSLARVRGRHRDGHDRETDKEARCWWCITTPLCWLLLLFLALYQFCRWSGSRRRSGRLARVGRRVYANRNDLEGLEAVRLSAGNWLSEGMAGEDESECG